MTAFELPRPRITLHVAAGDPWSVDFGNGATGRVWVDAEDTSAWPSSTYRWYLEGPGFAVESTCFAREFAFRAMWCRAARLSAPPPIEGLDFERAVDVGRADAVSAAAAIRELLEQRTGRRWSVRVGKGRASGSILVSSMPADLRDGSMTAANAALLAAVLQVDHVGPKGYTVAAKITARVSAVLAIAGVEPDGPEVARAIASMRPATATVH